MIAPAPAFSEWHLGGLWWVFFLKQCIFLSRSWTGNVLTQQHLITLHGLSRSLPPWCAPPASQIQASLIAVKVTVVDPWFVRRMAVSLCVVWPAGVKDVGWKAFQESMLVLLQPCPGSMTCWMGRWSDRILSLTILISKVLCGKWSVEIAWWIKNSVSWAQGFQRTIPRQIIVALQWMTQQLFQLQWRHSTQRTTMTLWLCLSLSACRLDPKRHTFTNPSFLKMWFFKMFCFNLFTMPNQSQRVQRVQLDTPFFLSLFCVRVLPSLRQIQGELRVIFGQAKSQWRHPWVWYFLDLRWEPDGWGMEDLP